jgi:hypothetical protein
MNKELIEELAEWIYNSENASRDEVELLTEWFEQNPVEPVVVGLTDEQADDLHSFYRRHKSYNLVDVYKEWAKTKTFAQPSEAFKAAMVEVDIRNQEIEKLKDDFIALESEYSKLKAQVTTQNVGELEAVDDLDIKRSPVGFELPPNWDNTPDDAVEYSVVEYFTTKEGHTCTSKTLAQIKRPTPPAPVVEVGRVWSDEGFEFEVVAVSQYNVCIKLKNGKLRLIDTDEFLAKFERVL